MKPLFDRMKDMGKTSDESAYLDLAASYLEELQNIDDVDLEVVPSHVRVTIDPQHGPGYNSESTRAGAWLAYESAVHRACHFYKHSIPSEEHLDNLRRMHRMHHTLSFGHPTFIWSDRLGFRVITLGSEDVLEKETGEIWVGGDTIARHVVESYSIINLHPWIPSKTPKALLVLRRDTLDSEEGEE